MQMFLSVMIGAALAVKGHEQLAKHIESSHACAAQRQKPDELVAVLTGERQPKNFILGEKAGEWRKAGDGEHGNEKRRERQRHPLLESTHFAHVLFMMHGVDHAAGAEEEASFEECVRH